MTAQVDAIIERAGLGGHRQSFYPTRRRKWSEQKTGQKVGTVVAMVFGLGLLGLIIVALIMAVPAVGLVLLAFVLVLVWGNYYKSKRLARVNVGRELRIHEHGVAVVGTGGASMAIFRWAEMSVLQNIVRHTRNGVHTHTTYAYTLSGPGMPTTQVNGGVVGTFHDPVTWGTEIQQQVTNAQLPPALAAVQAGQVLTFGSFTVNAHGLTAGNKGVAWAEVQQIKTERGFLSIKQQGRWLSLTSMPVSRIPNFFVFRTLADHLTESARGQR
ncbi:DUF6585 family protein [Kitasatospora viridis]|uniref:Uncharacterized protein n=1 Tax=Kitasatospora viridis TaxID=281105 RepID=A0A561S9H5_9ACTN|nr:DUF6585 family protein [Kitasatospora viridis]TWF71497.1 hypothetical protein FHX73_19127 [Kitasatospora viridis]